MSVPPPPREALKQSDGSFILQQDDGSSLRWTKRPDGTWRKPEHKKAGWVGDLEQAKYVTRGAQIEQRRHEAMHREIGSVPGMDPGAGLQADAKMGKAQRKNERKKEQRRDQAERKEGERCSAPVALFVEQDDAQPCEAVPQAWDGDDAAPSAVPQRGASQKALDKKLRQIAELEARRSRGEALTEDQLTKIASRAELESELAKARGGALAPTSTVEAPPAESASRPKEAAAAGTSAPTQNRKALEKKLKQIGELEDKKAKGEALNADQIAKLVLRPSLEAELRLC